jgi:transcriptional regulator with XRE-family HTH domain
MEKSTHTTEYAALRAELLAARKNAALSQRDLAAILDVPHSWVAKVESGERRIDLVEFCWFLSACGIDSLVVTERLVHKWQTFHPKRHSKGKRSK